LKPPNSISFVLASTISLSLLCACKKQNPAAAPADTAPASVVETPAAPAAPATVPDGAKAAASRANPKTDAATPEASAVPTAPTATDLEIQKRRQTLTELTIALHHWLQDKPDIPSNIDVYSLVRDGYLKAIPQPPPGLRYVVNPTNLQVEFAR
jgi:hypothetical protein